MSRQTQWIKTALFLVMLLFIAQGCLGTNQTVKLMEGPEQVVSCSQAQAMDLNEIAYDDLVMVLEKAGFDNELTCWKQLMKKSLIQDRSLPLNHLAKAVHVFNANESENEFSLATHAYFFKIARDNGIYREKDQRLMKAYVSFEIKRAKTKNDDRLKKAKLVCKRLDNDLYRKFFL